MLLLTCDPARRENTAARLSDRMPVILEQQDWPVWLGEG